MTEKEKIEQDLEDIYLQISTNEDVLEEQHENLRRQQST